MILLDTQALVWLMENDPRLGPQAVRLEAGSKDVAVSAISLWEISLLVSRERIILRLPLEQWMRTVEVDGAIEILPLTRDIAIDAGSLPGYGHNDPGDCVVIATARAADCPVMTADRRILAYAEAGHVRVIDARR